MSLKNQKKTQKGVVQQLGISGNPFDSAQSFDLPFVQKRPRFCVFAPPLCRAKAIWVRSAKEKTRRDGRVQTQH
jgi:hypothetical protein